LAANNENLSIEKRFSIKLVISPQTAKYISHAKIYYAVAGNPKPKPRTRFNKLSLNIKKRGWLIANLLKVITNGESRYKL